MQPYGGVPCVPGRGEAAEGRTAMVWRGGAGMGRAEGGAVCAQRTSSTCSSGELASSGGGLRGGDHRVAVGVRNRAAVQQIQASDESRARAAAASRATAAADYKRRSAAGRSGSGCFAGSTGSHAAADMEHDRSSKQQRSTAIRIENGF